MNTPRKLGKQFNAGGASKQAYPIKQMMRRKN